MESNTTERIIQLLKRLNAGENPAEVKTDAKEFLATVDPKDLSLAEQELMKEGLEMSDLRNLCSAHLEMLGDSLSGLKARLPRGHVLDTLISEHDMILGFLDQLEQTNEAIQKAGDYAPNAPEYATLKHLAEHLVGAEKHHQREEEVLFPEVEKRGVYGPTQVMKMEHEELREQKHRLQELAENVGRMDFQRFQRELDVTARFIVAALREHIYKENNVLYPTALRVIGEDEDTWAEMKTECDDIGYCCFTPEV